MTAGTVNCEGRLTLRVEAAGAATAVAEIVRSVEEAQARAAPVQRLADRVAGRFAVGVMAASAATFAFWAFAAPHMLPQARPATWGCRAGCPHRACQAGWGCSSSFPAGTA